MGATGARLVSMPAFAPEQYLKNLKQFDITIAQVAPPVVQFLAKSPLVEQYGPFPKLREIFCGAAPLGVALSEETKKRLKCEVRQGCGMTELSPLSHCDN